MSSDRMLWKKNRYGDLESGFAYGIVKHDDDTHTPYFASLTLSEPTTLAKAKAACKKHSVESAARSALIRRWDGAR